MLFIQSRTACPVKTGKRLFPIATLISDYLVKEAVRQELEKGSNGTGMMSGKMESGMMPCVLWRSAGSRIRKD